MLKKLLVVILSVYITGCASVALSPSDASSADYGKYPENYEAIVKTYFYTRLKDPDSAKYNFTTKPQKAYSRKAPIVGGAPVTYGYYVPVQVNSKNSFGGYTGWQAYRLIIRNGVVADQIIPNFYFSEPWYN